MPYKLLRENGTPIDASFDVDDEGILIASRGGTKGTPDQRNPEYQEGLIALLTQLAANQLDLSLVYVDSVPTRLMPINQRIVLRSEEVGDPETTAKLIVGRAKSVGRKPGAKGPGNATRLLRVTFDEQVTKEKILSSLRTVQSTINMKSAKRLPSELLNKVTPQHIFDAVEQFRSMGPSGKFGEPTSYLIELEDGTLLPPKEVFGLAATHALGQLVGPEHFSGGLDTPCFRLLQQAGLTIIEKDGHHQKEIERTVPLSEEERVWTEGGVKMVSHLRRERRSSLAPAKREAFRTEHGRLFCERCGFDPVESYGDKNGEACMEVHHHRILVSEMDDKTPIKLEDTKLLCANCHRVEHQELRLKSKKNS